MNVPDNCYEKLMTPVHISSHDCGKEFEYDGRNMEALAVLLDFLDYKLNLAEQVSNVFSRIVNLNKSALFA
jgi:hypothetical protein